jgi:hypothetical protein
MTKEQIIVIGFIAAAFLAGWIASLVTRRRARSAGDDNWLPPRYNVEAVTPPAPARAQGTGGAESPPLAEEVGQALRSDAANDGMLSVVRADQDAALSELELDLADWGFTYGVAWARARERDRAGRRCGGRGSGGCGAGLPGLHGRGRLDPARRPGPLQRRVLEQHWRRGPNRPAPASRA